MSIRHRLTAGLIALLLCIIPTACRGQKPAAEPANTAALYIINKRTGSTFWVREADSVRALQTAYQALELTGREKDPGRLGELYDILYCGTDNRQLGYHYAILDDGHIRVPEGTEDEDTVYAADLSALLALLQPLEAAAAAAPAEPAPGPVAAATLLVVDCRTGASATVQAAAAVEALYAACSRLELTPYSAYSDACTPAFLYALHYCAANGTDLSYTYYISEDGAVRAPTGIADYTDFTATAATLQPLLQLLATALTAAG